MVIVVSDGTEKAPVVKVGPQVLKNECSCS